MPDFPRWAMAVVAVGCALIGALVGISFVDRVDTREVLVTGCEANRTALRALYDHELKQIRNPDPAVLKLLNLTEDDIAGVNIEEEQEFEELKASVDPDDCEPLFNGD